MSEKKGISWHLIVLCLLSASIVLIPFPAGVVEILYGIELLASFLIPILTWRNKRTAMPKWILVFILFSLVVNIHLTRSLLIGLQDDTLLPLVLIFSRFCCQNSFVIGFILISFTLCATFILVKKGVERISEVSARFALDKMTTRMTNIDNKYAKHEITEEEAETKKKELQSEIDFFSRMDGAAKFISGSAKAILFMTSIDIAGGIAIGYFMQGKSLLEAIKPAILFTTGTVVLYCVPLIIISIPSVFCVTKKF